MAGERAVMTGNPLDERDSGGFQRTWIDETFELDAAQEAVFALLGDIDGWPRWSPGVRDVRRRVGALAPGTRFALVLDAGPLPFGLSLPCVVFSLEPARIEWGGGAGSAKIRHRFELTPAGQGRTRVRHVEYATGALALISLPIERLAHAHDARWSRAIRRHFNG